MKDYQNILNFPNYQKKKSQNVLGNGYASEALEAVSNYLLNDRNYYLVECSCNELNKQSSKVMLRAGFKKDGYIKNRRLNKDGTYSGVEYYSKTKKQQY